MTPTYSKQRPAGGVDNLGADADDSQPSIETMSLQLATIQAEMRKRQDDTGVHRMRVHELAAQVNQALNSRDEVKRTAARGKLVKGAWSMLTTLVLGGGGYTAYAVTAAPKPPPVTSGDVVEKVVSESKALEVQVQENAASVNTANDNIKILGREVVRRDKELKIQLDYNGQMLRDSNPKARKTKVPPSVQRRRDKKKSEALDSEVEDLFAPPE